MLADIVVFGCTRCATARNMADLTDFVRSLIGVDVSENAEVDTEEAPLSISGCPQFFFHFLPDLLGGVRVAFLCLVVGATAFDHGEKKVFISP